MIAFVLFAVSGLAALYIAVMFLTAIWMFIKIRLVPGALTYREWYRYVYLRSAHWQNYRARRLALAGYRCQEIHCIKHGSHLDVHHLTYANIGHELDGDTLVLCRLHHNMVSRGQIITIRN